MTTLLWAPHAWVEGGWRERVLLEVDARGHWASVMPDTAVPEGARTLPGPVLPGLVNAHSHAFQRAFAGLSERREDAHDDFWSWRDRMYGVALRITPEQLRAVAAQLYAEMLAGGYTQVCEFHYLQHREDGTPYDDPAAMSQALALAAADAGIGLTVLPVLYQRAGFAAPALRRDQRRFATDVDSVIALRDRVRALQAANVSAGVAFHSLRAAPAEAIAQMVRRLADDDAPIHIHVAEQTAEVDDCVAATGQRPIAWLCDASARHGGIDARWQLVHATHALPEEIDAVAASGAGVVLCPTTEANLGDGLADLPRWLAGGVPLALGSDSHVSRSWTEELRWLEYGQRLATRRRNVATGPAGAGSTSVGETLLDGVVASAARATGFDAAALAADAVLLDGDAPQLVAARADDVADRWIFAGNRNPVESVTVAGRRVVEGGRHVDGAAIGEAFASAMRGLLAD